MANSENEITNAFEAFTGIPLYFVLSRIQLNNPLNNIPYPNILIGIFPPDFPTKILQPVLVSLVQATCCTPIISFTQRPVVKE
jgi:hypothetical protein